MAGLAAPTGVLRRGRSRQVITVDLEHDLVFVTLATDSGLSLPVSEAILDAFAAMDD